MADEGADLLVTRVHAFLRDWRDAGANAGQPARLARFLRAFAAERAPPLPKAVSRTPPDPAHLAEMFAHLRAPLARHRESGRTLNPWTIAGLKQAEVRNAGVLATLWSTPACGRQASAFLNAFLRRIPDPARTLPTVGEIDAGYVVRREHRPVGEASERVDLTIEGRGFVLGVEVKINAGEGDDQLPRYLRSIQAWGRRRGKRAAVVLLAPFAPSEEAVLPATWADVAAAAREVVPRARADATIHQHLLDAFIHHIDSFGG